MKSKPDYMNRADRESYRYHLGHRIRRTTPQTRNHGTDPSERDDLIELLGSGTPVALITITGLIIGVRYLLISLSIAPYFKQLSTGWKWVLAYFLWTPNYALSVERFDTEPTTSAPTVRTSGR